MEQRRLVYELAARAGKLTATCEEVGLSCVPTEETRRGPVTASGEFEVRSAPGSCLVCGGRTP